MEQVKKQRGGARPGAGRKRKENARTISVSLSLSPKAYNNLLNICMEKSATKNDIINRWLENL